MVMIRQNPYAPEEAVYILRTPPRPTPPEYKVIHARAHASLVFKDVNDPNVGADFTESAVDTSTVQAIERVWGYMTMRAHWPNREDAIARLKWGGTRYVFDYLGDNVHGQGDTVSPEHGTCAGGLVELAELLIRIADEPDTQKKKVLHSELLEQSWTIFERLNAMGAPSAAVR